MEPFGSVKQCPKCGESRISNDPMIWPPKYGNNFKVEYRYIDNSHIPPYLEPFEHMRVTCRRCGYAWEEAPLDREEKE